MFLPAAFAYVICQVTDCSRVALHWTQQATLLAWRGLSFKDFGVEVSPALASNSRQRALGAPQPPTGSLLWPCSPLALYSVSFSPRNEPHAALFNYWIAAFNSHFLHLFLIFPVRFYYS